MLNVRLCTLLFQKQFVLVKGEALRDQRAAIPKLRKLSENGLGQLQIEMVVDRGELMFQHMFKILRIFSSFQMYKTFGLLQFLIVVCFLMYE